MTEITRVPLQPVAKGALTKLWLGIALAVALGGAVAYESRQPGLVVKTIVAGKGAMPTTNDVVLVNYVGHLNSGKVFDQGNEVPMAISEVLPGFSKALQQMQKGGKYHIVIPARLAYGGKEIPNPQTGEVTIPANSDLTFDVDLIDFKSQQDVLRQRAMMRQLQQQMQAAGAGAPGAAAPGGGAEPSAN